MKETCWMDANSMRGVLCNGDAVTGFRAAAAGGAKTLYLCGSFDPSVIAQAPLDMGWKDAGSNLDRERPFLRLKGPEGSLSVVSAANWLGSGDYSYHTARRVMQRLDREMWDTYASGLWIKPSTTGLEAWRKTAGDRWPTLPREAQELISSTSGQGRFECCTLPTLETIGGLYLLDGAMMYAANACAVEMSSEVWHEERPGGGWHDSGEYPGGPEGFLGWTPGRYRVRFRTPADWRHVGLLGVRAGGQWTWPSEPVASNDPRWSCDTWADAKEVRLAIAHGWHMEILERLLFVRQGKSWHRPLRTWASKLMEMHDRLQVAHRPQVTSDAEWMGEHAHLYHAAIRNIIIQTIGAFASRARTITRTVGADEWDQIPDDRLAQDTTHVNEDGTVEFAEYELPRGRFAALRHPEFAAAVWADTRVRLLSQRRQVGGEDVQSGALHLPRERVIGFQLDSIFSTADPGWPTDGRPGGYRVKQHWSGPMTPPRTYADLLRLKGAERE